LNGSVRPRGENGLGVLPGCPGIGLGRRLLWSRVPTLFASTTSRLGGSRAFSKGTSRGVAGRRLARIGRGAWRSTRRGREYRPEDEGRDEASACESCRHG